MSRVVALSGSLGSTSAMWDAQAGPLERAGFRVVRLEHPGHGGTPVEDVSTVAELARRAVALVGGERFAFVGLSLGGAIGIRLALDAPDRVERLVLACTSARFGSPAQWRERAATVRAGGMEAVAETVLARWFTPSFDDVRRYREMLLSTDPEGYARCCEAVAGWDARDELVRLTARTLVISGADDPATPPEHGDAITAALPAARHHVLADARHLANVERAEEFNALLLEHLG